MYTVHIIWNANTYIITTNAPGFHEDTGHLQAENIVWRCQWLDLNMFITKLGQHQNPPASTPSCWFIFPCLQATSPCSHLLELFGVSNPRICSYSCRQNPNHHQSPYMYHCNFQPILAIFSHSEFPSLDQAPCTLWVNLQIFAGEITVFANSFWVKAPLLFPLLIFCPMLAS